MHADTQQHSSVYPRTAFSWSPEPDIKIAGTPSGVREQKDHYADATKQAQYRLGAALLERPTSEYNMRTYAILRSKQVSLVGDLWPPRSHRWPSGVAQGLYKPLPRL